MVSNTYSHLDPLKDLDGGRRVTCQPFLLPQEAQSTNPWEFSILATSLGLRFGTLLTRGLII